MKKVLGILLVSCICLVLGLSVKWSREHNMSLATTGTNADTSLNML